MEEILKHGISIELKIKSIELTCISDDIGKRIHDAEEIYSYITEGNLESFVNLSLKGIFTGETDKNGVKIFYETSKLRLPNGTIGKLMFDTGQLAAYFAGEDNSYLGFDGVNNINSFNLRDCEVIN